MCACFKFKGSTTTQQQKKSNTIMGPKNLHGLRTFYILQTSIFARYHVVKLYMNRIKQVCNLNNVYRNSFVYSGT